MNGCSAFDGEWDIHREFPFCAVESTLYAGLWPPRDLKPLDDSTGILFGPLAKALEDRRNEDFRRTEKHLHQRPLEVID